MSVCLSRAVMAACALAASVAVGNEADGPVLKADDFKRYVDAFNRDDNELYRGAVFGKLPPAPLAAERRVRCRPAEKIGKAVRPEGLISGGE